MSNYKRKKPRKQVKCTMCTDAREGNSKKLNCGRKGHGLDRWTKSERKNEDRKEAEGA